jgi:hypothetical protein
MEPGVMTKKKANAAVGGKNRGGAASHSDANKAQ